MSSRKSDARGLLTPSVAGEAEQMAAVVHEFVHIHALYDRGCALFSPDEIDAEQHNEAREDDPRKRLAKRDRGDAGGWGSTYGGGHQQYSSGNSRPYARCAWPEEQV